MILKAIIEDQVYELNVPESLLSGASDFFDQLDRDMDAGWQMSRDWVDAPNREQRAQIVADKLLTALEKDNERLGMMMAGYLLSRLPHLESVEMDITGEIQNTEFHFREQAVSDGGFATLDASPQTEGLISNAGVPRGLSRMKAMAQAGNEVTKVFKVGRGWRFSVFDHASGGWLDGPLVKTEAEADRLRQIAFKERYEALTQDS